MLAGPFYMHELYYFPHPSPSIYGSNSPYAHLSPHWQEARTYERKMAIRVVLKRRNSLNVRLESDVVQEIANLDTFVSIQFEVVQRFQALSNRLCVPTPSIRFEPA